MKRLFIPQNWSILLVLMLATTTLPAHADTAWDSEDVRRVATSQALRAVAEGLAAVADDPRLAGVEAIAVLPVEGVPAAEGDELTAELRNLLANTPFRVYDRVDFEQLYGEAAFQEDYADLFNSNNSEISEKPETQKVMPVQAYLRAQILADRSVPLGGHRVVLTWNLSDVATWNVLAGNTVSGTARSPIWPAALAAGGVLVVALLGAASIGQVRHEKQQLNVARARAERLRERTSRDAIAAEALRATHSLREAIRNTTNPALLYRLRASQVALDALRREVASAWPLNGPRAEAAREIIRWQRIFMTALSEVAAHARAAAERIGDPTGVSDLENQLDNLHSEIKRLRELWQTRADRLTPLAA